MPLLPPEGRTPVVIKRTDGMEVQMPEAADIPKRLQEQRCLEKYEESGDNLGVMGTCLTPQAEDGSTNLPEEDIQCDQILVNDEENRQQATEAVLIMEPMQRSNKQVEKGNDHGMADMDKVKHPPGPIPRRQGTR